MDKDGFLEKLRVEGKFDPEFFTCAERTISNPEVERIVDSFKSLVKRFPPAQSEIEGKVPGEAMEMMSASGAFGMTIPKEYGGLGLDFTTYLEVVREITPLDMSLAMVSLAHLSIGLQGVVLFGNEAQKKKYLEPAARGELIFAYALTEPDTGSDAQNISTTAERSDDGSHYILTGRKAYITNANYAGAFTLFAQIKGAPRGRMGAFIVEADWEGVEVGPDIPKMGLKTSSTAAIILNNVKVPAENLLGEEGEGFRYALTVLSYGRLAVAASGVGLMYRSLQDMGERASKRIQFGQPIAKFDLIKEKLASAASNAAIGDAMVCHAAALLDASPASNVAMETSHCKLFCTTKTWDTLYDALQVAGGSGYLSTNPYERRMRDWRVTTIFEGTTEIHSIYPSLVLARDIGKRLPKGRFAAFWQLLKGIFTPQPDFPKAPTDGANAKAFKWAKWCHRSLNAAIRLALIINGKKITDREYLLRKLTWLGTTGYGLFCLSSSSLPDRKINGITNKQLHEAAVGSLCGSAPGQIVAALITRMSGKEKRANRLAERISP